jgi:hypothetical protein
VRSRNTEGQHKSKTAERIHRFRDTSKNCTEAPALAALPPIGIKPS